MPLLAKNTTRRQERQWYSLEEEQPQKGTKSTNTREFLRFLRFFAAHFLNYTTTEIQQKLTARYAELFAVYLKHPAVTRVSFWCVCDGDTWLNDWPVKGRTNHPLLFDREGKPKSAFWAVIRAATPE